MLNATQIGSWENAPVEWLIALGVFLAAAVFAVWSWDVWSETPKAQRHWLGLLPTIAAMLVMVICLTVS